MGETFLEAAEIEFQACLELLAERARFLTHASRAAIALSDQDRFIYRAASGEWVPRMGEYAEIAEFRRAILAGEPAFGQDKDGDEKFLLVPIRENQQSVGFFKLWGKELGERELRSVEHLQEMVLTAIEHLEAAEKSGQIVAQAFDKSPTLKPATNSLEDPPLFSSLNSAPTRATARVHSCRSCGFPVSDRRSLCLDCEERAASASPSTTTSLFDSGSEESWLHDHFYTIASLVITALAAAAIYWLR
jgi:hypothetical protein